MHREGSHAPEPRVDDREDCRGIAEGAVVLDDREAVGGIAEGAVDDREAVSGIAKNKGRRLLLACRRLCYFLAGAAGGLSGCQPLQLGALAALWVEPKGVWFVGRVE